MGKPSLRLFEHLKLTSILNREKKINICANISLGFSTNWLTSRCPFSHKLGLPKDSYQFNISQCQLFLPCLHAQSSNGSCLSWMNLCQDSSWFSHEHSSAFRIHELTSPEPNEAVVNTEDPSRYQP